MPKRSLIKQLPKLIRAQLDEQLSTNGFREHVALSDWLGEKGYQISRSSVQRHSKALQSRIDQAEGAAIKARAIAEVFPDSDPSMGAALTGLVQQQLLDFVLADGFAPELLSPMEVIKAIAEVNRAEMAHQRWKAEAQAKIDEKLNEIEANVPSSGLNLETIRRIREEIYGIV